MEQLHIAVADDGCGMEATELGSHFGLSGMRERVEMAGGLLSLEASGAEECASRPISLPRGKKTLVSTEGPKPGCLFEQVRP